MRINTPITTAVVEALHVVPVADVVDNAYIRDVVGNKADAKSSSVTTDKSVMTYVKGAVFANNVPSADAVANGQLADVVGNKADTEQATVVDTASLVRYQKALIQELAQRGTPKMVRVATTSDTLSDVLNITDKGVLTGIVQNSGGADVGYLKITIDGVVMYAEALFVGNNKTQSLAFNHRFNTSLRVEHENSGDVVTISTFVSYTTD